MFMKGDLFVGSNVKGRDPYDKYPEKNERQ